MVGIECVRAVPLIKIRTLLLSIFAAAASSQPTTSRIFSTATPLGIPISGIFPRDPNPITPFLSLQFLASFNMDQTPQEIARMQEEIERLKAELEKTGPRVYKEINVFVANWIYEDLDHDDEINALETLFRKQYRCSRFMHYQMGDEEPQKDLTDLLKEEMTGHEGPEILWIFIYTGHGGLTKPGNTLMWAA